MKRTTSIHQKIIDTCQKPEPAQSNLSVFITNARDFEELTPPGLTVALYKCMKTRIESKKTILKVKLVAYVLLSCTSLTNTSEAKSLPVVNLDNAHSHQQELIGAKRAIASLGEKADTHITNKIVAQVVLDETTASLPEPYKPMAAKISTTIIDEANKYKMDPLFLIAVIKHESYFNPEMIGLFKEVGLMQIKPSTAEWLNKKIGLKSIDLKDPIINIKLGAAFLNQLRDKFENDSRLYIAAYNMGAANVRKLLKNNKKPTDYPVKVMRNYIDLIEELEVALMKEPFPTKKLAKNEGDTANNL